PSLLNTRDGWPGNWECARSQLTNGGSFSDSKRSEYTLRGARMPSSTITIMVAAAAASAARPRPSTAQTSTRPPAAAASPKVARDQRLRRQACQVRHPDICQGAHRQRNQSQRSVGSVDVVGKTDVLEQRYEHRGCQADARDPPNREQHAAFDTEPHRTLASGLPDDAKRG